MQVENYLKKHQPIIYQTFVNSLQTNRLSHAYLLSGVPGTPLLDIAKFLAKSILCDNPSPLACDSCITCLRVDDENYPDYFLFDGSKNTITKDSVAAIEHAFDKKAFEAKGIRIYILHLVENMTTEAINSILKFLEEPGTQIFAFLTTNNEASILPTIVSRCQTLKIKLINRKDVIEEAKIYGVEQNDAEILSYFYNSGELIDSILKDEDTKSDYLEAKGWFENLIEKLSNSDKRAVAYYVEKEINPKIKSKESMRLFIDILSEAYEDMLNIQNGCAIYLNSYATILTGLVNKLPHIKESLVELQKCRTSINSNINTNLLCDYIMYFILKEEDL